MKSKVMLVISAAILSTMTISASASSSHFVFPVAFTLVGGPGGPPDFLCPELPTGLTVTGSGEEFQVFNMTVTPNGVTLVEVNDLKTGSATDSNGATYLFNYHNHQSAAIPAGGFPFTIVENDHFNLVGNGQASQLQVHFNIRITFNNAVDPPIVTVINNHDHAFACDPI
jgi:hypothetical protein